MSYTPAMTVEQGRNQPDAVQPRRRKKLMHDRLSVTLRVIDPFNTSRETSMTIDPRFFQISSRAQSDSRTVARVQLDLRQLPRRKDTTQSIRNHLPDQ